MFGSNDDLQSLLKRAKLTFDVPMDGNTPERWAAEMVFRCLSHWEYRELFLSCLYEGYHTRDENGMSRMLQSFSFDECEFVVAAWTISHFLRVKAEESRWLPIPSWWCTMPLEQRKLVRRRMICWLAGKLLMNDGDDHGVN